LRTQLVFSRERSVAGSNPVLRHQRGCRWIAASLRSSQ